MINVDFDSYVKKQETAADFSVLMQAQEFEDISR